MITANRLLETRSGNYEPSTAFAAGAFSHPSRKPQFQRHHIPLMLAHPHVQLGLKIIRGRIIARSRFFIEESDSEIRDFIIRQITRFWMFSANRLLSAIPWGFVGSEALYVQTESGIEFKMIKNFHQSDTRIVTNSLGEKAGITVRRASNQSSNNAKIYLGGMKSLWHIHNRDIHPWYGSSILFGSYDPWYESFKDGGARDIRNLYFHKYAFSGDVMYYPPGTTPTSDPNEPYRDNREVAREIVEKRRTGGVVVFPNQRDENGNQLWTLEPASPGPGSSPVLEYNEHLKTEILEGMGVPREVVEAAETGSGYSGRAVPLEAFDSTLQDLSNWLIYDFDEQILRPLIQFRYNIKPNYEITPFGLARGTETQEQLERSNPDHAPDNQRPNATNLAHNFQNLQTNEYNLVYWR